MDEHDITSLDIEFKKYLQIMRPYLAQLGDTDVIELCKAWIQRLSSCNKNEKPARNKYVFALCYQLAKGILEEPFLTYPPTLELQPLTIHLDSDGSVSDADETRSNCEVDDKTKVIYNNKNEIILSDTDYYSQQTEMYNECKNVNRKDNNTLQNNDMIAETFLHNICLEPFAARKSQCDDYKERGKNLIKKLRDLKTENLLLHRELEKLKEECNSNKEDSNQNSTIKVDCCTSACFYSKDTCLTLDNLRNKFEEVNSVKNTVLETNKNLRDKLNNFEELKRQEIEEIAANSKMEIIKIKTATREETKEIYEKKLDEIKVHYEKMIDKIHSRANEERQELITSKDEVISEKDKIINSKEIEIARLKSLIDDQKNHLHDIINKFLEKPIEDLNTENMRIKTEQLEKRLLKVEKAKSKGARLYEAKLAQVQREKHLAECSLQLQLVRQRAQVVSDVTDESQTELNTALSKLENKYKEIVVNMQSAAIQRRVQDQKALETILHAACGIRNEGYTNASQVTNHRKTMQSQNKNGNSINQSFDSELSTLLQGNKAESLSGVSKSLAEEWMAGYCLDGERMGELFERVYIPQRDIGDAPLKK